MHFLKFGMIDQENAGSLRTMIKEKNLCDLINF